MSKVEFLKSKKQTKVDTMLWDSLYLSTYIFLVTSYFPQTDPSHLVSELETLCQVALTPTDIIPYNLDFRSHHAYPGQILLYISKLDGDNILFVGLFLVRINSTGRLKKGTFCIRLIS